MVTQSSDTNPEVERFQISLLRKASIAERLALMQSLTSTTIQLSKRAIARANPALSKKELDLLFVKYHYGDKLALQLRDYLIRNGNE
ncbi:MAG: hypothetical protein AB1298_08580 [Bacteroidota bacterium]